MTTLDPIDEKILELLQQDSRLSHKEIGELVYRSGQAVGSRILQMKDKGIIEKYSIHLNHQSTQFIRIIMKSYDFEAFEAFVSQFNAVEKCYKVSGSCCYMLVTHFNPKELNLFIDQLSDWGNYTVDSVVKAIDLRPNLLKEFK